ncbi:hypothetical protein BT96DRAFT_1003463 [Gymnopus androsaceus JB14]|uniref:Uncharacterized protein n=1 Tax=Gymnopus androsaceus JB14 TaxID=1447944 RepID=A0A6A4GVX4_9AGAR|nr:hypothetical protein BT96DRAFT_1003463 [Gymnopus androsaceus JB14]
MPGLKKKARLHTSLASSKTKPTRRSNRNKSSQPLTPSRPNANQGPTDQTQQQQQQAEEDARLERQRRRKYDEFAEQVAAEAEAETKSYKTLRPFQQIGLYTPRCFTLYCHIQSTLNSGLEHESKKIKARAKELAGDDGSEDDDDDNDDLDEEDLLERKHLLNIYDTAHETFPFLTERLLECLEYEDEDTFDTILSVISKGCSEARRNDTNRLKSDILKLIPHVFQIYSSRIPDIPQVVVLDPPCLCDAKSDRGVSHWMIAMLFCPHNYIVDIVLSNDESPNRLKQLMNHRIPLTADDLPMFLYDLDLFKATNMWRGLLRGRLLIVVCRSILLGPGAAMSCRDRPARSCNSVLLGITEATAELIAYVAVQARFALCSQSSWTNEDSKFKFDRLYFNILRIINNSTDKWRSSLLLFWNHYLSQCFSDLPSQTEEPNTDSNLASLFTQSSAPFDYDSDDARHGDFPDDGHNDAGDGDAT